MLVHQVQLAAFQVISAGTDDQVTAARKVLTQTRRSLYRILAEDESTCTVYGMPRAIVEADLADAVLPRPALAAAIVDEAGIAA